MVQVLTVSAFLPGSVCCRGGRERTRGRACHRGARCCQSTRGVGQVELLSRIAQADRLDVWRDDGARDMSHWLAHALRHLRVEGPSLDRRGPRAPCPPGPHSRLRSGSARDRQGRRARSVRHARHRGQAPAVGTRCVRAARSVGGAICCHGPSVDEVVAVDRARTLSWWSTPMTASGWSCMPRCRSPRAPSSSRRSSAWRPPSPRCPMSTARSSPTHDVPTRWRRSAPQPWPPMPTRIEAPIVIHAQARSPGRGSRGVSSRVAPSCMPRRRSVCCVTPVFRP